MDEDTFTVTDEELVRMAQEWHKEYLLDPDRVDISGSYYDHVIKAKITDSDLPLLKTKDPGAK